MHLSMYSLQILLVYFSFLDYHLPFRSDWHHQTVRDFLEELGGMPPTGNEIKFGGNFDWNLLMLMNSSMLLFILAAPCACIYACYCYCCLYSTSWCLWLLITATWTCCSLYLLVLVVVTTACCYCRCSVLWRMWWMTACMILRVLKILNTVKLSTRLSSWIWKPCCYCAEV